MRKIPSSDTRTKVINQRAHISIAKERDSMMMRSWS
jgi:hypothetical protein